ncbi:MAG: hypothetical protein ACRELY_28550 [Polyangiaceae bacterium]
MAANAPLPGPRSPLDSLDDSTGPATPYVPGGESRPALFAADVQPRSGFRVKNGGGVKLLAMLGAAYFAGVLTSAIAFYFLR